MHKTAFSGRDPQGLAGGAYSALPNPQAGLGDGRGRNGWSGWEGMMRCEERKGLRSEARGLKKEGSGSSKFPTGSCRFLTVKLVLY